MKRLILQIKVLLDCDDDTKPLVYFAEKLIPFFDSKILLGLTDHVRRPFKQRDETGASALEAAHRFSVCARRWAWASHFP